MLVRPIEWTARAIVRPFVTRLNFDLMNSPLHPLAKDKQCCCRSTSVDQQGSLGFQLDRHAGQGGSQFVFWTKHCQKVPGVILPCFELDVAVQDLLYGD
ncbi:hypothetical protein WK35_07860 [Burkholderia vietnamiensis]|nr:hypothetical protein WK29_30035 [Burkholderia vietnamiensis]KVS32705.1 hypothetical protein WK35_07860 [Burkholderia vietnamiensis]